MKLVIFGATGGTGKALVTQALEAGHEVTVAVRHPEKYTLQHDRLHIEQVDVFDVSAVDHVLQEKNAVLSALGIRKLSIFGTVRPDGIYSRGIQNIIAGMQKNGVRRLVCVTSAAADDRFVPPGIYGKVIMPIFMRQLYQDMKAMQRELSKSTLDWIVVRPARLTDYPRTDEYRISLQPSNQDQATRREDLAAFMLKQLTDTTYLRKLPVIAD